MAPEKVSPQLEQPERQGTLPEDTFVAIGLDNIIQLATFLKTHDTIRPKHVLLADTSLVDIETSFGFRASGSVEPPPWVKDYLPHQSLNHVDSGESEEDTFLHNRTVRDRIAQQVKALPDVIDKILRYIDDSVETLSVLLYVSPDFEQGLHHLVQRGAPASPWYEFLWAGEKPRYRFPHLHSLTLRDISTSPRAVPPFPNLTHLHLIYDKKSSPGASISPGSLREALPRLSHLRYTGCCAPHLRERITPFVERTGIDRWLFPGWWTDIRRWTGMEVSYTSLVPMDLTLIVHPHYDPVLLDKVGIGETTGLGWYDLDFIPQLAKTNGVHLSWPSEENYIRFPVMFMLYPVDQAVRDFVAKLTGKNDGEWTIQNPAEKLKMPVEERWWRKHIMTRIAQGGH
ncbi:hypothetical protein VNI00_010029 [Paramarasmius palmivorus]|uniref:Uncharacterized protein n=1 Tax=Paramarasmius palmivorus TaxID=297713 RepID=A0AAW0CK57_9AGAR